MFLQSTNKVFVCPCSSKKVESEGGASAAKKDSKRKRESSVSDCVEVKSPPSSPPEEEDDDGVQVRRTEENIASSFESLFQCSGSTQLWKVDNIITNTAAWFPEAQQKNGLLAVGGTGPGGIYCLCSVDRPNTQVSLPSSHYASAVQQFFFGTIKRTICIKLYIVKVKLSVVLVWMLLFGGTSSTSMYPSSILDFFMCKSNYLGHVNRVASGH